MQSLSSSVAKARAGSTRRAAAAIAAIVIGLGASTAAQAQGGWTILGHPAVQDLKKLSFTDDLHGWVCGDAGTILKTGDGGQSWVEQTSPVGLDLVDIDMLDEQTGWILAQEYGPDPWDNRTTLLHTTNGGAEWVVQAEFDQLMHAVGFSDALHGCVGGDGGVILRSVDGGRNWSAVTVEAPETARWPVLDIEFYSPTFALAAGGLYDATGLVWRTVDGGRSWTHVRVAGEPVWATHAFDDDHIVCVGGDLDYGAGSALSSEGGQAWEYTDLHIWGQAGAVSFRNPVVGWAPLGFAGTAMYTVDGGHTWTAIPTPDGTPMFDVAFTSEETGYMVGAGGTVLKYVTTGTGVGDLQPGRPSTTLLFQNTPNPVGEKTQFGFRLADEALVTLKIYDLAGREVATVLKERLPAGTYTRTFEAERLASGVYYYKLTAGSYEGTKRMLVLR
jgi:photosystem II stability/assembly factor-like uncharacterized protein